MTITSAAFNRASSRRFTTYWAAHGETEDEARRLIEHRGAELIPIKDAEEFFGTVQQHVESLLEFARPHPLSTEAAVASLETLPVGIPTSDSVIGSRRRCR